MKQYPPESYIKMRKNGPSVSKMERESQKLWQTMKGISRAMSQCLGLGGGESESWLKKGG